MKAWLLRLVIFGVLSVTGPLMPARAQEGAEPRVEVELSETEVIPGQPALLRITVLVPTWLPRPVAFPTFEVPDLLVKLPERATTPVSRTIEGATWSGVSRGYRVSPMVPGMLTIPAQELTIYWAQPGQTDPLVSRVPIAPMTLTGRVPVGAEGLDPFIAATALTLTQELSTEARVLKPGDSLTRKVVLDVEGTSPLFLPRLLPPHSLQGIASYPAEPVVTETQDRVWVSGTRVESTTLVAESGGSGSVPPVEVTWYNLDTQSVETTRIDGFDLRVDGPVARSRPDIDLRHLAGLVLGGGLIVFGAVRVGRRYLPKVLTWVEAQRRARQATESWAYRQMQHAVGQRDYAAFVIAFEIWAKRLPDAQAQSDAGVTAALSNIGRSLYGPAQGEGRAAWSQLSRALQALRARGRAAKKQGAGQPQLSPLNPH